MSRSLVRRLADAFERHPDGPVLAIVCREVAREGGRALVVGGWVRDELLGRAPRDLDLEVYGLGPAGLEAVLRRHGEVLHVGRSFGVLRVKGLDVDVSLPGRGPAAAGPPGGEPFSSFEEASRRRDLRVNSMAFDPVRGEFLDPHGGLGDLERGRLRATDARSFGDDPLRGLRVARLAACLGMEPDPALLALAGACDLSRVPGERLLEEWRRLLLEAPRPARGLRVLEASGLRSAFPELDALAGTPTPSGGDAWRHTCGAADRAAELRRGDAAEDLPVAFAVLCHATGVSSSGEAGDRGARAAEVAARFLERLRASRALLRSTTALVAHHRAPIELVREGAAPAAWRRLARRLAAEGASLDQLESVARAHALAREEPAPDAAHFAEGDAFLERARALGVARRPQPPAVQGRHLVARGLRPGPAFGRLLDACCDEQDRSGETDPEVLLGRVLSRLRSPDAADGSSSS